MGPCVQIIEVERGKRHAAEGPCRPVGRGQRFLIILEEQGTCHGYKQGPAFD
jgi:hypothetical protein